jgi:hypothetical protein
MARVVGMPLTKAKNWTMGRPIRFQASLRAGRGTGSRNLYNVNDVYLMSVAYECSKAGMAAKAIGKLIEAVREKFPNGLDGIDNLYVSRGPKLAYRTETREDRVPRDAVVRVKVNVQALRTSIDREVARLA